MLRTNDGGKTWIEVSNSQGGKAPTGQSHYPGYWGKNGLRFLDASTGWVTGTYDGVEASLYITHDGGQSWYLQHLPLPALISSAQTLLTQPTFFTTQDGILSAMGLFPGCGTGTESSNIYVTHNGVQAGMGQGRYQLLLPIPTL